MSQIIFGAGSNISLSGSTFASDPSVYQVNIAAVGGTGGTGGAFTAAAGGLTASNMLSLVGDMNIQIAAATGPTAMTVTVDSRAIRAVTWVSANTKTKSKNNSSAVTDARPPTTSIRMPQGSPNPRFGSEWRWVGR